MKNIKLIIKYFLDDIFDKLTNNLCMQLQYMIREIFDFEELSNLFYFTICEGLNKYLKRDGR